MSIGLKVGIKRGEKYSKNQVNKNCRGEIHTVWGAHIPLLLPCRSLASPAPLTPTLICLPCPLPPPPLSSASFSFSPTLLFLELFLHDTLIWDGTSLKLQWSLPKPFIFASLKVHPWLFLHLFSTKKTDVSIRKPHTMNPLYATFGF